MNTQINQKIFYTHYPTFIALSSCPFAFMTMIDIRLS